MSTTNQYLLYTALVLGSVGTYGALKSRGVDLNSIFDPSSGSRSSAEVSFSEILSDSSNVSISDLTVLLDKLSKTVDTNSQANSANSRSLKSVVETSSFLQSEIEDLKYAGSRANRLVDNFNNNSTLVHSRLSDLESTVDVLGSFGTGSGSASGSNSESDIVVDEVYVKQLGSKISLLESSIKSSKEASFSAQDKSEINSDTIAGLKSSVDTLVNGYTKMKGFEGRLTELADVVESNTGASHFAAISKRVESLSSKSDGMLERVNGVETLLQNMKEIGNFGNFGDSFNSGNSVDAVAVDSGGNTELMIDIKTASDVNSQSILALRGKVDSNAMDIATFVPDLQEQISTNKSELNAISIQSDANLETLESLVNPRLSSLEENMENLKSVDSGISSRLDVLDSSRELEAAQMSTLASDVVDVSERVTSNLDMISGLRDDLEGVYNERINNVSDTVSAVSADVDFLGEKLYRSNDDEIVCTGLLRAEEGAKICLAKNPLRLGASTDDTWMLYLGEDSSPGLGFSGNAQRMRIKDSVNEGFVLENSSNMALMSVRGSDGLTGLTGPVKVMDVSSISSQGSMGCFGHWKHRDDDNCALRQDENSSTLIGSSIDVKVRVRTKDMLKVEKNRTVVAQQLAVQNNADGSETYPTMFRAENNIISTGKGKENKFRFGNTTYNSVIIREDEIQIKDTNVREKLIDLQTQIESLKLDVKENYVKKGEVYWMKGHKDSWGAHLSYDGNNARWGANNTRMKFKIFS